MHLTLAYDLEGQVAMPTVSYHPLQKSLLTNNNMLSDRSFQIKMGDNIIKRKQWPLTRLCNGTYTIQHIQIATRGHKFRYADDLAVAVEEQHGGG